MSRNVPPFSAISKNEREIDWEICYYSKSGAYLNSCHEMLLGAYSFKCDTNQFINRPTPPLYFLSLPAIRTR